MTKKSNNLNSKPKALVLFSGGLDSMLAVKILQENKIQVSGLTFKSPFFDEKKAVIAAKELDLKLIVKELKNKYLETVKNPKYGYGKNFNPCIDCHAFMLKEAKKIKTKENFQIIATGEVLGQRPFSQNKQALLIIEKITDLENQILRPLSAKWLKSTVYEESGLIKRENLLDIQGRSRKKQLNLAKKFKLKQIPTAAGGCLLTDPQYAKKARSMKKIYPKAQTNSFEIIKHGRFFDFEEEKAIIIIGRNQADNQNLEKLTKLTKSAKRKPKPLNDILIEMQKIPGPLGLIRFFDPKISQLNKQKITEKAKKLIIKHASKAKGQTNIDFSLKLSQNKLIKK
jgi:tRNA U34 2-thiouridine synthase MnmA/TrmU